jgi:DNA repair protein RecO (recombination protein O)
MIQKSNAIVLSHLKYSETSIIVHLYTEAFGRQSYMINGIRSVKSKQKMGLFQPLFLLEIEAYQKQGRDVQRLKEFKVGSIYSSIPFDIVKSTMAMFMAEMLTKVLRSEAPDTDLFEFLVRSLQFFDTLESGVANFHLWFLVQLLSYLGFQIENNYNEKKPWFDMKNGRFVPDQPIFPNTPNREESKLLASILSIDAATLGDLKITGGQRTKALELITEYYSLHFDGIGTLNSLKVLHEIYR